MILRPETDVELIAVIAAVCGDALMEIDTRACVALLLSSRRFEYCPTMQQLAQLIAIGGKPCGTVRLRRMVREAISAGWMARATWRVPRRGRRPMFSFIVGRPDDVCAFVEARRRGM